MENEKTADDFRWINPDTEIAYQQGYSNGMIKAQPIIASLQSELVVLKERNNQLEEALRAMVAVVYSLHVEHKCPVTLRKAEALTPRNQLKSNMEKNIKDYLHLYLGCKCMNNDGDITRLDGRYIEWMLTGKYDHLGVPLLLLRPLSDMTEEEALFIDDLAKRQLDGVIKPANTKFVTGIRSNTADAFLWFLSKGFDLFGLIDAGLAIDATKIERVTPEP